MKGAIYTPAEDTSAAVAPAPAPAVKRPKAAAKKVVRAREDDGQFKADNPTTPDVNEAWTEAKE